MENNKNAVTLDKVYKAAQTLKPIIRQTDMILAPNLRDDAKIYLKTENLQVTGSFKIRGSYFKISQLSEEEKKKGVIACSPETMHRALLLPPQKAA